MEKDKDEFQQPSEKDNGRLQSLLTTNSNNILVADEVDGVSRSVDEPTNIQTSAVEEFNVDVSHFRNSENGFSRLDDLSKVETEATSSYRSLSNGVEASTKMQGEICHLTTGTAIENVVEQSCEQKSCLNDVEVPLPEEGETGLLSPSRYSTVSSFDSTTNGEAEQCNVANDDDDDDRMAGVAIDPLILFGSKKMDIASNIIDEINLSSSLVNDDKSIRSESTRPDPPSILDGRIPSINGGNEEYDSLDDMNVHLGVQEIIDEQEDRGANLNDAPASLTYDYDEDKVARALATLSKNVAEATLQDDDKQHVARRVHDNSWDLNRKMFLAATPKGETKSISKPLESALLAAPLDLEEIAAPPFMHRQVAGPDNLVVLPRVDDNFYSEFAPPAGPSLAQVQTHPLLVPPQRQPQILTQHQLQMPLPSFDHAQPFDYASRVVQGGVANVTDTRGSGRRKIRLRLQEEILNTNNSTKRHFRSVSLLSTLRKNSGRMLRFRNADKYNDMSDDLKSGHELYKSVDRGIISVSWYDGTSSLELQQHVRKCVLRKLRLENTSVELEDMRILDETTDPPEEIVLSPYMPNGSQFLLRFCKASSGKDKTIDYDGTMTPLSQYSGRPPVSPSAAPSPHPEKDILSSLNANQLALLNSLKVPTERSAIQKKKNRLETSKPNKIGLIASDPNESADLTHPLLRNENNEKMIEVAKRLDDAQSVDESTDDEDDMQLHSEDPIETRLREITLLLLADRKNSRMRRRERQGEKRQVIFVVANYFVLFLALIAVSAEIQARAPKWLKMMEDQLQSVQNCGENHEALFECVSRGDFAGLIASVILWLSRSVATRRIFLFGFDTPKKLWTVVYESLVTSICWGISYLFIRRGMNPDTRPRFVQKYWKDAVYGSLAGFNAAFLKQILKNLVPQEVVEDALRERQLKILKWLPSFS